MCFKSVLETFDEFNTSRYDYIKSLLDDDKNRKLFVETYILNNLNKKANITDPKYKNHVLAYLAYVIIRLFTPHEHDTTTIDLYDSESNYEGSNKSNYYNIVKRIKSMHTNLFMASGNIKLLLVAASCYGENKYSFNDTLINMFNVLTNEQILFLGSIIDCDRVPILESLGTLDVDSVLYYYNNENFVDNIHNIVMPETHSETVNYMMQINDYDTMLNYFNFTINKLYNDTCLFPSSQYRDHQLSSEQLKKLLLIISCNSYNIQYKFSSFCKILNTKQLVCASV
jgi:hypothetical protein